jgi:hypothetical protein
MPYIEKTGNKAIAEQLWQWEGVMHDPNIDGFNGWGCKKKIYQVYWQAKKALENAPEYADEDKFLHEHNKKEIEQKLKRKNK